MTDSQRIARHVDADHVGPPVSVTGVDSLATAGDGDLAFCVYDDDRYVRETDAVAVLCPPTVGAVAGTTQLVTDEPRTAFAVAANEFLAEGPRDRDSVHPTASVHDDAEVGDRVRIGPHVAIGADVRVGDDCSIRAGASVGCPGFGFGRDDEGVPRRLPHRGRVRIEDGAEIGANATVDRAVFDETVIGRNAKLSANVHVAHQVRIGQNVTVAYGTGFSGRVTVGDGAVIQPHVAVATGVDIGSGAEVGINSTVLDDVPAGETVVGSPARNRSKVSAE
mgnify:CR=1 FL=1